MSKKRKSPRITPHDATLAAQREVYAQLEKIHDELVENLSPQFHAAYAYALHEVYGFGAQRLGKVMEHVDKTMEAIDEGYLTFSDLIETLDKECCIKLVKVDKNDGK